MARPLIVAKNLQKIFLQGFWMKRVEAVRGISFTVREGDIFGFLGPNGAGKTTTIKMLTGLIAPSDGTAKVFDERIPSPQAMARVGFLPENPYVYPYLTPQEFVGMCARISGVKARHVRERTRAVLDKVGILYAADRPVRRLSKGMLQRTGLAAALVSDPELLVLDEPMSGLDPVGRKEVRDIILEERNSGRTIFFSTHILSDVETLCDRVTILRKGRVVVEGSLSDLLNTGGQESDIVLQGAGESFEAWCRDREYEPSRAGGRFVVRVPSEDVNRVLRRAIDEGLEIVQVLTRQETLEDLFVREAIEGGDDAARAREPDGFDEDEDEEDGEARTSNGFDEDEEDGEARTFDEDEEDGEVQTSDGEARTSDGEGDQRSDEGVRPHDGKS